MPRGDRTGPEGQGSMTGRGLGSCAGNSTAGFQDSVVPRAGVGRGLGFGRGIGRGLGRGFGLGARRGR